VPTIQFAGKSLECLEGANLRMVLLRARLPLYHSVARALHCRGFGNCGTCAVRVEGHVSPPTAAEQRRLAMPPHDLHSGLRLACQVSVLGDVTVTKYEGLFGQKTDRPKPG
jgi:ferredoxin